MFSKTDRAYGGVAILVKKKLAFVPLTLKESNNYEVVGISLVLKNSEKIDIISFYSSKGNHTDLSSLSIKTIPFSGVTSIVTTTFGKAIQPQTLAAMP